MKFMGDIIRTRAHLNIVVLNPDLGIRDARHCVSTDRELWLIWDYIRTAVRI